MDCSGQGRHRDCQRRLLGRRGARLYCEDKDIAPATPDGIRDSIFAAYRSCNTSPAFKEGFRAFELAIASCCNPYENRTGRPADLNAHAWSRGMNAAISTSSLWLTSTPLRPTTTCQKRRRHAGSSGSFAEKALFGLAGFFPWSFPWPVSSPFVQNPIPEKFRAPGDHPGR
jgi:hypothetical protein